MKRNKNTTLYQAGITGRLWVGHKENLLAIAKESIEDLYLSKAMGIRIAILPMNVRASSWCNAVHGPNL
jgi:hypothetical protein